MGETWADGERYEAYVGRWSRRLAPKFLAWTGIPRGSDVLDVGCGTGALSEAAWRLGARTVLGIDASEGFVAHAAATVARGHPEVRFESGDAMHLRFAPATFDAVVSGLVLNFLPDAARAVSEWSRVARPGGTVAAFVWDYAGRMELMRHFWDAAVELDPASAGSEDEGVRFPICNPRVLESVFRAAGLGQIETGHIDEPTVFRDFDDYWTPFLSGQAPAPGYAMLLDEGRRAALRERIRSRLPIAPDGRIALVARAWCVRGAKP